MNFTETKLKGAFIIDLKQIEDHRGFFALSWSRRDFEEHGLNPEVVQCNLSFNRRSGTVRGMHWQEQPHAQAKLVRCTRGALHDAIIDLRPGSPTFRQWVGVELSAANRRMLFVPTGFAHGFQTLEDDTEISYQMSAYYHPASERGVRWNDPAFGLTWPREVTVISPRDRDCPDFVPGAPA